MAPKDVPAGRTLEQCRDNIRLALAIIERESNQIALIQHREVHDGTQAQDQ